MVNVASPWADMLPWVLFNVSVAIIDNVSEAVILPWLFWMFCAKMMASPWALWITPWWLSTSPSVDNSSLPLPARMPCWLMMLFWAAIMISCLLVSVPCVLSKWVRCQLMLLTASLLLVLLRVLVDKLWTSMDDWFWLMLVSAATSIPPAAAISAFLSWLVSVWVVIDPLATGVAMGVDGCVPLVLLELFVWFALALITPPLACAVLGGSAMSTVILWYKLCPMTAWLVLVSVSLLMASWPLPVWISLPALFRELVAMSNAPP